MDTKVKILDLLDVDVVMLSSSFMEAGRRTRRRYAAKVATILHCLVLHVPVGVDLVHRALQPYSARPCVQVQHVVPAAAVHECLFLLDMRYAGLLSPSYVH